MTKVAVGLSGGVDSAVCTLLLRQAGFEPIGVFLRMHRVGDEAAAARRAAEELGIPFYLKDLTAEFEQKVMRPFAEMYKRGETPNPCLLCNPQVKFKGLLDAADALGCEKIATGHYAAIEQKSGRHLVCRTPGQSKDQSYMLYGLSEDCRKRLILPLGEMTDKAAVRKEAAARRLSAAGKKDSLDICFLEPGRSHGEFIETYTGSPPEPGLILDPFGKELGRHEGICHYTIGQRRGLGVAASQRLYVSRLDPDTNTVVLGPKEQVETKTVRVGDLILHRPLPQTGLTAKIRYRDRDTAVRVELLPDGEALLHFDAPKSAAAPGQSAVLYLGDTVVGGGVIKKV